MPGGFVAIAITQHNLENFYGAVRAVSIEFLKSARTDIIAETSFGEHEVLRLKKLLSAGEEAAYQLHAEIRSKTGEIVATSEAKYFIRPQCAA